MRRRPTATRQIPATGLAGPSLLLILSATGCPPALSAQRFCPDLANQTLPAIDDQHWRGIWINSVCEDGQIQAAESAMNQQLDANAQLVIAAWNVFRLAFEAHRAIEQFNTWLDAWTPQLERYAQIRWAALLCDPQATSAGISVNDPCLSDRQRQHIVADVHKVRIGLLSAMDRFQVMADEVARVASCDDGHAPSCSVSSPAGNRFVTYSVRQHWQLRQIDRTLHEELSRARGLLQKFDVP